MSGWSYDASGNLLNDGAHSYSFDAEGRIKSMDGAGGTYTYGPDGERVRKDSSSGSVEYVYFGSAMIAELNPATGAWTDYIFAGGKRIAKDTSSNASGAQYYQGDHLGSTRIMTDASGTKISDCTYAPYGEQVACSPDNPSNRYRFTGKERDSESQMDYFGARYYSSPWGRFLSADWSEGPVTVPYAHLENPQTLNLYAYVDNNPINGIDADGHAFQSMVGGSGWDLTGASSDGSGETTDGGSNPGVVDEILSWLSDEMSSPKDGSPDQSPGLLDSSTTSSQLMLEADKKIGAEGQVLINGAALIDPTGTVQAGQDFLKGNNSGAVLGLALSLIPSGGKAEEAVHVYQIVEDGKIAYVGITNNLIRREAEQGAKLQHITTVGSRMEARAVEQALIEHHGLGRNGGSLRNKINSISPKNPGFADYVKMGFEVLSGIGYPL